MRWLALLCKTCVSGARHLPPHMTSLIRFVPLHPSYVSVDVLLMRRDMSEWTPRSSIVELYLHATRSPATEFRPLLTMSTLCRQTVPELQALCHIWTAERWASFR